MALHVRGERGRRVVAPVADCTLEWFPMVVCFQVNLEMVAAREGARTVLALVALVAGVQLNVPVAASLVLEGSITIVAGVDGARAVVVAVMVVVRRRDVMVVAVVEVGVRVVAAMGELLLVHERGRGTA